MCLADRDSLVHRGAPLLALFGAGVELARRTVLRRRGRLRVHPPVPFFPFRVASPTSRSTPFGAGALPARVSSLSAVSPERVHCSRGLPHLAAFRPQVFATSRRFAPPPVCGLVSSRNHAQGFPVQGFVPDPQRLPARRRKLPPCRWAPPAPLLFGSREQRAAHSPERAGVHKRSPRLRGFVPRIDRAPPGSLSLCR